MKRISIFLLLFIFGTIIKTNAQNINYQRCGNDAANSANPMDSVGVHHNDALFYLTQNFTTTQLQDNTFLVSTIVSYIESTFGAGSSSQFSASFTPSNIQSGLSLLNSQSGINPTTFVNSLPLTTICKSVLQPLINNLYTESVATSSFSDVKSIIVAWESGVTNSTLSAVEKEQLYVFASTLRYSLLSWELSGLKVQQNSQSVIAKKLKWWQWICVGLFDAGGAVAGATVGGVVGGVAGGAVMSGGCAAVFSTW